ncbi:unnamed protein product, partial [marine sediment metagenome]
NQLTGINFEGGCELNLLFSNFFRKNGLHALTVLNNKWNNSEIGNYWDNYTGIDANEDGVGDKPHNISTSPLIQDFLPIVDNLSPEINVVSPYNNSIHGATAPSFNLSISEKYIDETWYSLDGGVTNISFTGLTETFDQAKWEDSDDGKVLIRFYASDKAGNEGFSEIQIEKDSIAPIITINQPVFEEVFDDSPPMYNISVDELHLYVFWYSLDDGINNYTGTGLVSMINQTLWDGLQDGELTLHFYAKDEVGNYGESSVLIIKRTSQIEQS